MQHIGYIEFMSIILTMTSRGVLTLPAKLRKAIGLRPGDPILAEATDEGLLLRPAAALPIEMYSTEREAEFDREEDELKAVLPPPKRR
jgi:AbrB family looped-hinge helix DNA binding protein